MSQFMDINCCIDGCLCQSFSFLFFTHDHQKYLIIIIDYFIFRQQSDISTKINQELNTDSQEENWSQDTFKNFSKQQQQKIQSGQIMDQQYDQIAETKKSLQHRGTFASTEIWLEDKAQMDTKLWGCPSRCWIIENKMYNLQNFASIHPGGKQWIQYTKGHEITELFRVHHLNIDLPRSILSKYYIGQCPIKHPPRFDFDKSGLFEDLRKRILKKYTVKELQDSKKSQQRSLFLITIGLVLLTLVGLFQSYLIAILYGLYSIQFWGIGHMFMHKKPNWLSCIFFLIGFTPKQQIIMHCISHHVYANTSLDYQYTALEPIIYFGRNMPQNSKIVYLLAQVLYLLISFANIITKIIVMPIITKSLPNYQYIFTLTEWAYLFIITGDLFLSFKLFVVIKLAFGFCLGKTVICQHKQPQVWSMGAKEVNDYVLHMALSTFDIHDRTKQISSLKSLFFYMGFDIHVIHHIFPTIDHNMLSAVNQIFNEFRKQKGIKLFENQNLIECNKNLIKVYQNREPFSFKNIESHTL